MSENSGSGMRKEQPAPCYRCLFDKPIDEGSCDPSTCLMLDKWLLDDDFSWSKYYLKWMANLEIKNTMKNMPIAEE